MTTNNLREVGKCLETHMGNDRDRRSSFESTLNSPTGYYSLLSSDPECPFVLTGDDPFLIPPNDGHGLLFSTFLKVQQKGRPSDNTTAQRLDVMRSDELIVYLGLDRLRKPHNALQILMKDRGLPFFRIGGRLTFRKSAIDAWIANGGDRKAKRGRPKGSRNKIKGQPLSTTV